MGKQENAQAFRGRVEKYSYFKDRRRGHQVRTQKGVEGARIKQDPRYARTRENAREFGNAVRAMKMIRHPLLPLLKAVADGEANNRLSSLCAKILKTDSVNDRGMRSVAFGDLSMLVNFNFNKVKELNTSLDPNLYSPSINRITGEASISVESFVPKDSLDYPPPANHFRLVAMGLEIDFDGGAHLGVPASTGSIEIGSEPTEPIILETPLPPNSEFSLILVLGILFEDYVNGKSYPLNDTSFNTLAIVAVDSQIS